MIKIKTSIDNLFEFIEDHSPVKESRIPKHLKKLNTFESHIKVLEVNGMIDVKLPMLSAERIFVFKTKQRMSERNPWDIFPHTM